MVWLTGASSGIGESLAYELAKRGASVALTARRESELQRVRAACENSDKHFVLPVDLLEPGTFETATKSVLDHYGHVDVLIHCAGISQRGPALSTDMGVFRKVFELNFFAPVALTKLVLPSMIERHSGQIVAISSVLGKFSTPQRSAYSASKHALNGFCDALRSEVYKQGVGVTVVCPGFVRTNVSFNALSPDGTPFGKMDKDISKGLDSDVCARRIADAIEARKREVYLGRQRFAVYLNRFLPGLFSVLVRRRAPK